MKNTHENKPRKFSVRVVITLVLSAVFFAIYALTVRFSQLDELTVGAVMFALLLVSEFIALKIYKLVNFRMDDPDDDKHSPILGNITLDFILRLYLPVVICDESGKIIWYNDAFTKTANPREVLYTKYNILSFMYICGQHERTSKSQSQYAS